MGGKYKIKDQDKPYFITFPVKAGIVDELWNIGIQVPGIIVITKKD